MTLHVLSSCNYWQHFLLFSQISGLDDKLYGHTVAKGASIMTQQICRRDWEARTVINADLEKSHTVLINHLIFFLGFIILPMALKLLCLNVMLRNNLLVLTQHTQGDTHTHTYNWDKIFQENIFLMAWHSDIFYSNLHTFVALRSITVYFIIRKMPVDTPNGFHNVLMTETSSLKWVCTAWLPELVRAVWKPF